MKKLILLLFPVMTYSQSITLTPTNGDEIIITNYGPDTPIIAGRKANGTPAAPTSTSAHSTLLFLGGRGFDELGFNGNSSAAIRFLSNQNFTSTAHGAYMTFSTTTDNEALPNERMRIAHNGNIGIGTTSPLARVHVSSGTSGVTPFTNTTLFTENSNHNYLHMGAANGFDNGILFSNAIDNPGFGGGIIYKADDRLSFVMNGGTSRMLINSSGNVGIGTTAPTAKLDVNGTTKIGTNGTAINEIIRHTQTGFSFSQNPNPGSETTFIISVPNAQPGSAIAVTTSKRLPAGVIQNVSCEVAGEIRVGFYNTTSAVVNLSNFDINIAVIR